MRAVAVASVNHHLHSTVAVHTAAVVVVVVADVVVVVVFVSLAQVSF